MRLGIDFGTTNTSAAVYDGRHLNYIPLDPQSFSQNSSQNRSATNLRSMIYVDNRQRVRLGIEAVETFLREDTGRPVVLEEKMVGTIENTVASQGFEPGEQGGPITIIYDVLIHEDVGIRGRLLQSLKTALRSADYTGTKIFGRYYTVEELIAFILRHVRQRAEAHLEQPVQQALIGRPVTFSQDAAVDRLAEEKLRRAAHLAGFDHVDFMAEPVAAAAFYANRTPHEQTFLVFDFGGGTLDLTVLKASAGGQLEALAAVGVLVGGDDLDSAIMRGKVAPYFGTQSAIDVNFDGRPIAFPDHLAELLEQWQTIPTLTRPENLRVIERGIQFGEKPDAFKALATLATKNYGFALFQAIEQTKRELSQQSASTITMQLGRKQDEELPLQIPLAREEFNRLIAHERAEARSGIRQVLSAAGVKAEQIAVVVVTGGSSAIPAFHTLLKSELPDAELVVSDLFGSVTGGLAIQAHQHALA